MPSEHRPEPAPAVAGPPTDRRVLAPYLASETLSLLGNSIIAVALPLLVLQRTGSALAAGVVAAAATLPSVAAGLLGGAIVDRLDRRRVSVGADLLSAASVAALPVVDRVWGLDLGWFVVLGAVGAFGDLPGLTARDAMAPTVAARVGLAVDRVVALREGLGALVMVVGPAVAGLLLWLLPGATVLWVTAATSAGAALVTLLLPRHTGQFERTASSAGLRGALAGFAVVRGDLVIRTLLVLSIGAVAVLGTLQGLVLPVHFAARDEPGLLGTVLSALAVGLLLGAGGYAALAPRLPPHRWFGLGLVVVLVGLCLVAALPPFPLLLLGAALAGVGSGPVNAVAMALVVTRVHEGLRGRVMAAQNTLMMLALPVVLLPVAVVVERISLRWAAAALGLLWVTVSVWALLHRGFRAALAGVDDGALAVADPPTQVSEER